jgi:hypothetical protein
MERRKSLAFHIKLDKYIYCPPLDLPCPGEQVPTHSLEQHFELSKVSQVPHLSDLS